MRRQWLTVMMIDLAGYGRLVSHDEETAVLQMLWLRGEVIEPSVAAQGGRIVDYAGDGALVRFTCAAQAMTAALAMQTRLDDSDGKWRNGSKLRLRIGLDCGPVIPTGAGMNGLGIAGRHVNIASRLEALAPPGGVCLSGRVYAALNQQVQKRCRFGGEPPLKHINEPVAVWYWAHDKRAKGVSRKGRREPAEAEVSIAMLAAHWQNQRTSLNERAS